MQFIAIIPARYASTRFPGKPLADMGGKPMIQRVVEQALQAVDNVFVATDDERIAQAVTAFGGKVIMTSPNHTSGTDRCYEAYTKIANGADVIINIQGDEPFIQPQQIQTLMSCFDNEKVDIATLGKPFLPTDTFETLNNPNSPKIILNNQNEALYFSRSVIPYLRNIPQKEWCAHHTYYKHIGMYGYRANALKTITSLPIGKLEAAESLEQLRWIENGLCIKVGFTQQETIGIDTPEDLAKAIAFLSKK